MEHKYKDGEVVFDRMRPMQKLIIRKYSNRVYYCKVEEDPRRKELSYFERELSSASERQVHKNSRGN